MGPIKANPPAEEAQGPGATARLPVWSEVRADVGSARQSPPGRRTWFRRDMGRSEGGNPCRRAVRREDVAGRHLAEVSKAGFQLSDTTSKSRARRPGSPMSFPGRGVRASKIKAGSLELTLNGRSIALRELAETVPQLRCSLTEPGPPAPQQTLVQAGGSLSGWCWGSRGQAPGGARTRGAGSQLRLRGKSGRGLWTSRPFPAGEGRGSAQPGSRGSPVLAHGPWLAHL